MKCSLILVQFAMTLPLIMQNGRADAQCLQNHYVSDGAPSSQHDCQPFASFLQLTPEQMTPSAQALVAGRHADLVKAAQFYGFNLDGGGWTYTQSVSPILQKHLLLAFTHTEPARQASLFTAVVPLQSSEPVQVVPSFAHGLRLFDPGWQKKGTYSVFNRLLQSERGNAPVREDSDWTDFASLYLALTGIVPAVPTDTDSVEATWKLTQKRATTPVIIKRGDGSATIAFSDIGDSRTTSWKLVFNKNGQLQKVNMDVLAPQKMQPIAIVKDPAPPPLPVHSSLNP